MSGSTVEPHDKMRARDVSKVARGEQAPRPPQRSPPVSHPPPPSSTTTTPKAESSRLEEESASNSSQMRRCYQSYHDYHKCVKEKGTEAEECHKIGEYYKSRCPDWIGSWRIQ